MTRRISATVVGVYGTVHADVGDFDTTFPTHIDIDCEMIRFNLPVPVRFTGELRTFTFYFGTTNTLVTFNPPVRVTRHDQVTVVMPVAMDKLVPVNRPEPGWSRR